uniref:NADH-ubiquinone oxidoreductase chain 3 n=1 Tax=Mitromorpha fischeri TaxID=2259836 RepID=A0A344H1U9_9COND|nr:NADH dehydrogenase subunit 3 [Mitromorpha fischeri]
MCSVIISSVLGIGLSVVVMMLGWTLAKRSISDREKNSPFECGFDPIKSARLPFSMRFFLLAIIFLIFDIEIVLLFPILISVSYSMAVWTMSILFIFLVILVVGLFHEWNEGSLDWAQ